MKIILFFIFFPFIDFAQNLVPNPSFEDTLSCPDGGGDVLFAEHWQPLHETPDYFNACATDSLFRVPNNYFGFQEDANGGHAYVGLYSYFIDGAREMIGVELTSPLSENITYYYSFKVSRTRNNYYGYVATNKIGIKLLNQLYSEDDTLVWSSGSQIYLSEIVTDSFSWTKVSGYFIADSAYRFISIGNHFDNSNTDTLNVENTGGPYAYYYIDDICISKDSSSCEESFVTSIEKHSRSPTATFFDNILRVKQGYYLIKQITLMDMLGNTVFKTQNIKTEYELSYLHLNQSIYNVLIDTHKSRTSIKIIKQ